MAQLTSTQQNQLKERWKNLAASYTNSLELIGELWLEIEKSHSSSQRHYHNLSHLDYMMDRAIKYQDHLIEPDTVMFSIFYHDIVYNVHRQDNEQRSAEVAADRLGRLQVPDDKVVKCQHQIIATKYHEAEGDDDAKFLIDFDLVILGDSPEKYREYTKKIRREIQFTLIFFTKREERRYCGIFWRWTGYSRQLNFFSSMNSRQEKI